MIWAEGIDLNRATHERAHDVAAMLSDFNAEFDTPCPSIDVLTERFQRLLWRNDVIVCIADGEKLPAGCFDPAPTMRGLSRCLKSFTFIPSFEGGG